MFSREFSLRDEAVQFSMIPETELWDRLLHGDINGQRL